MYSRDAKEVRQVYQEYFTSSHGEVPWQWNYVDSVYNTFHLMHLCKNCVKRLEYLVFTFQMKRQSRLELNVH